MYLKKQDLSELDYKLLNSLTEVELSEYCKLNLYPHQTWLPQQMVANFGQWKLQMTGGKIDILATLKHNVGQDPKQQTLWRLTRLARSDLIKSQSQAPEYAQLTPLILMGFKRYQGVEYSEWQGLDNLEWVLEPKLLEAVSVDLQLCSSLGSDRLLEIRNQGLMNKVGAKMGQLKSAETTWSLTGVKNTEIGHLPKLTQTMLCQIWLAHPAKRTQYMILDPKNWDQMPKPLVEELFQGTSKTIEQFKAPEKSLPWL